MQINIVEDVLVGSASEENFIAPSIGDNFDISFDLETILAAVQLIVAIYQVLQEKWQKRKRDDYVVSQTKMREIVENCVNAANPKAWDILDDKQKADFVDSLLRFHKELKWQQCSLKIFLDHLDIIYEKLVSFQLFSWV